MLKQSKGELLIDAVLEPGDVLFVPARFPHTTNTVVAEEGDGDMSISLTFGVDNHVWDLNYATLRRFGLIRAGVEDVLLPGDSSLEANQYVGKINELPLEVHEGLLSGLHPGLLSVYPELEDGNQERLDEIDSAKREVAENVMKLNSQVDPEGSQTLSLDFWLSAVSKFRETGQDILAGHRDMYLAAIDEEFKRRSEGESPVMTQDRINRMSLFRVPKFFEEFDRAKGSLREWVNAKEAEPEGAAGEEQEAGVKASEQELPADWAKTYPLKVGDAVEADLGGCFFPATIQNVAPNGKFDVKFFDGEVERGVERSAIILTVKPALPSEEASSATNEIDTSKLTKKEIKKLRKAGLLV